METAGNGGKAVFHDVVPLGGTSGTVFQRNSGEKHPNATPQWRLQVAVQNIPVNLKLQISDGLEAKRRHWGKLQNDSMAIDLSEMDKKK